MKRLTYGISGVLLVLLACVAAVGCDRATPSNSRSAQPPEGAAAAPKVDDFRSYHDDPLVIDNGPIRIRVGNSLTPVEKTRPYYKWTRQITEFVFITNTRLKQNGRFDRQKSYSLCATCVIKFELEPIEGEGTFEPMSFSIMSRNTLLIDTGNIEFELDGVKLRPAGNLKDNLRIKSVSGIEEDEDEFTDPYPDKKKHLQVHIGLTREPEAR